MSEVARREAISIVVSCYNEEEVFPHLQKALSELADSIVQDHDVEIILVDDQVLRKPPGFSHGDIRRLAARPIPSAHASAHTDVVPTENSLV